MTRTALNVAPRGVSRKGLPKSSVFGGLSVP